MAALNKQLGKNPAPIDYHYFFAACEERGKTEARQQFLNIVDVVQQEAKSLTITDRGEKVAVIMGYKQFQLMMELISQRVSTPTPNFGLQGLIVNTGDLDSGNQKVNDLFDASIKKFSESV